MKENTTETLAEAGVAALAAASKTPFRTAFMVTMGITTAYLTTMVIMFSVFLFFGFAIYEFFK